MKNKKFGIAAVLLSVAWVVAALAVGLNTYDGNTYQTLLAPTADTGVGSTGTAVNVGPYEGIATILFSCTKNVDSNGTNVITLQSATASARQCIKMDARPHVCARLSARLCVRAQVPVCR